MRERLGDKSFQLGVKLPTTIESEKPVREITNEEKEATKNDMWTDRYKPKGFNDLVGNSGAIGQLYEWLKDWDDVCIRGHKKQVPVRRGMSWSDAPNLNARAALISGPPGIGKTSAARIVCA